MSSYRTMSRRAAVALILLLLLVAWVMALPALAQDDAAATEEPAPPSNTPTPPPSTVSGINPILVTRGQPGELLVYGTNFGANAAVQVGSQALSTTLVNNTQLRAALPPNLQAGTYPVSVIEPGRDPIQAPNALQVIDPPTETPTATPTPKPLQVNRSEPFIVVQGNQTVLSVFGKHFTAECAVRLVGVGVLETTFVNSGALTALIPASAPLGQYEVQVGDWRGRWVTSPNLILIVAPTPTPPPPTDVPPPTDIPEPTATLSPATPLPGQPSLLVRNFSATPDTIAPGDQISLAFEVVNQGNRTAQGIAVSVDNDGKFVPAGGQSSAILPDIGPGGTYRLTLDVVAVLDIPAGPNSIPITLSYYDFEGTTFTSKGTMSVMVSERSEASQVVLSNYAVDPNPVQPGQPITVTGKVTNSGNKVASQVLLRFSGTDSILLPGPQGDSLPLGDLQPGASVDISLQLVVSSAAEEGTRMQPVSIHYLQEQEEKEIASSITVDISKVEKPAPLLLLESYDIGKDHLQPGDQFTLTMQIKNVGDGAATDLLVTFGTVQTSDDDQSNGNNNVDQSSTTPSTTFAPLGAGGTVYVGTVESNNEGLTLEQAFIVDGSINSGIYSLPITLRYLKPDGSEAQDNLRASVVVIAPPTIQISMEGMLPETVNVGEPFSIPLTIQNTGSATVNLTTADTQADNGEVMDGAEIMIGALPTNEDTSINALVMALEEGPVKVDITIHYINDLNQEATLVQTYETEAILPPPMPEDSGPPPDMAEEPVEEEDDTSDKVGRFLLGLLGLGS